MFQGNHNPTIAGACSPIRTRLVTGHIIGLQSLRVGSFAFTRGTCVDGCSARFSVGGPIFFSYFFVSGLFFGGPGLERVRILAFPSFFIMLLLFPNISSLSVTFYHFLSLSITFYHFLSLSIILYHFYHFLSFSIISITFYHFLSFSSFFFM